jgi:HAD superfamily hydrolase (TIGR01509 family)
VTEPSRTGAPAPIAAVVFDLDGVLVDAELVHRVASRRLVAPEMLTDEEYAAFVGTGIEPFAEWVRRRYAVAEPVAAIVARYDALVSAELAAQRLPAFDGAHELLGTLRARGLPLALASQSLPRWVELTLAGAGLARAFDVVLAADAAARAKPAPDLYLHAAARLSVAPARCLAIEDSIPGVAAAVAAGMRVVQSRQASTAVSPQPGIFAAIDSLRAFDLRWLDGAP